MNYTIWGNGGRFEYLIRAGNGNIISRSGLIYPSRSRAKSAMLKDDAIKTEGN